MLILAIDTSHKNGSVCLARGNATTCEVIGAAEVDGGMFSAQLVPVIARLLMQHGLTKNDLQGIAAAVGPGSFTGLRIGLAAVKGFAEVLRLPVAAVSTLEAVAESADAEEVFAVLDAGRQELYVGEYRGGERVREFLCNREEFVQQLSKHRDAKVTSPETFVEDLAKQAGSSFSLVQSPGAEIIAQVGLEKLTSGHAVAVDELDANYVRRDESLFGQTK